MTRAEAIRHFDRLAARDLARAAAGQNATAIFNAPAPVDLSAELAQAKADRKALAEILSGVDAREHNRAVLAWKGNLLDYTHAMLRGLRVAL